MRKMFTLVATFFALLTIFTASASAAGGSSGTVAATSPYEGPLTLLSIITLAIMIYLPLRDHN